MQYRVHVYAVVRAPLAIEADSQIAACKAAMNRFSLYDIPLGHVDGEQLEDAEEIVSFMVDEIGDDEFSRTQNYGFDGKGEIIQTLADAAGYRMALQAFADAYCPPDGSGLVWEDCNAAYQNALAVLGGNTVRPADPILTGIDEYIADLQALNDEPATKLPVWRVTARYSDGEYWGDDVRGRDRSAAIVAACDAMVEAGEGDRNSIEIVDCDLVDFAKDHAAELLAALQALLPEIDSEIEQRKFGGNDEHWRGLQALSNAGHAAVRAATNT